METVSLNSSIMDNNTSQALSSRPRKLACALSVMAAGFVAVNCIRQARAREVTDADFAPRAEFPLDSSQRRSLVTGMWEGEDDGASATTIDPFIIPEKRCDVDDVVAYVCAKAASDETYDCVRRCNNA
ncbi:unnamed protein product, partial [Phaeothamnion confervicola]